MFISINVNHLVIVFSILDAEAKIVSQFSISSIDKKTSDQYMTEVYNVLKYLNVDKTQIDYVSIISVVPKFTQILIDCFEQEMKIKPIVITNENIPLPVISSDINIKEIPVDIFSMTYAVSKLYRNNVIVVNFSETITFGILVDGKFAGYTIFPSSDILSMVLHEKITNYPEIAIKSTKSSYGIDKYSALNCGIFNGLIGACDNIISGIKEEFGKEFKVIASHKDKKLVNYSKTINIVDTELQVKSVVECTKSQLFSI